MPFIGNARQQADNDVAVLDAWPLSECWQRLQTKIELAARLVSNRTPAADAETQRWTEACIAGDMAARQLRAAIANGDLKIWRIREAREVPVTPRELLFRNIRSGVFTTYERPGIAQSGEPQPPDMQGALLWVKRADWERFVAKANAQRHGAPPNRKMDHDDIRAKAAAMRAARPDISIGSAAASIVADLAPNPKSGRQRNPRYIEKMIAPLWEGESRTSPR